MADCKWCGLFDAYLCPRHAEERQRELEAKAAGKLEGAAAERHEEYEPRSLAGRWRLTLAEALEAEVGPKRGRPPADRYPSWLEAIGEKGRNQVAFLTLNFVARALLRPVEEAADEAEEYPLASSVGQKLAERLFKDRDLRGAYDGELERGYRRSIGMKLIQCMESSTRLIVLETRWGGRKRKGTYIRPTESLWQESRAYDQWVRPLCPPMVQEPHPWSQGQGGYRYDLEGELDLGAEDAPGIVRAALDRLQTTAWRINRPVLDLVKGAFDESDVERASQIRLLLGIPDPPPDWALKANQQWAVKKMAVLRRARDTLASAEECLHPEARFYLPHHLDWRGRMYPAAELLNPQGGDLSRALLLFAEGKPLGEAGARWLAIHGANCFGERGTLYHRVQWAEEHTEEIVEVAADPLRSGLLANAKPKSRLQFYAFALEWSRLQTHLKGGQAAPDFVSSLPCGQDHTCSGVQHIAALLRNKTLARATNVLPGRPRDFYEIVTKRVIRQLEAEAEEGVEQARLWLKVRDEVIARDLIKKFAMTFDYGATSFGFGGDIGAYVREQAKDAPELQVRQYWPEAADEFEADPDAVPGPPLTEQEREALQQRFESGPNPWDDYSPEELEAMDEARELYELGVRGVANNYLAKVTEEVMKQETKARAWFRECAKAIAETDCPVSWTVPVTGFEVVQNGWHYMKKETTGRPHAGGSQLVVLKLTDSVEPAKQANGLAPNVIHSLDAANIVLTINSLPNDVPLGTAHDCYYVLAADAEHVNRAARKAFVQLHREPILDQLHAHFSTLAGRSLRKPRKGQLDIEVALDSTYLLS